MSHEPGNYIKDAAQYWEVIRNLAPLALVGGVVAMITNLPKIVQEKPGVKMILTAAVVVFNGAIGAALAALGLVLFVQNPTVELQIVAAAIAGSASQKTFDVYGRRIFGWRTRAEDKDALPVEKTRKTDQ